MITGFNTDIEYDGVVYHVQTEDKGLDKPVIMSLVYTGGEIIASKRSPYDDLIDSGFDETVLTERLNRQHKLICAAIHQGRIEDLRRMSRKNVEKAKEIVEDDHKSAEPIPDLDAALASGEPILEIPVEVLDDTAGLLEEDFDFDELTGFVDDAKLQQIDAIEIDDVSELVITDLLPETGLTLRLLEEREMHGGDRVDLRINVFSGRNEAPWAEITVKVLGSSFRPQIFHALANENGQAVVQIGRAHV